MGHVSPPLRLVYKGRNERQGWRSSPMIMSIELVTVGTRRKDRFPVRSFSHLAQCLGLEAIEILTF